MCLFAINMESESRFRYFHTLWLVRCEPDIYRREQQLLLPPVCGKSLACACRLSLQGEIWNTIQYIWLLQHNWFCNIFIELVDAFFLWISVKLNICVGGKWKTLQWSVEENHAIPLPTSCISKLDNQKSETMPYHTMSYHSKSSCISNSDNRKCWQQRRSRTASAPLSYQISN